MKLQLAMDFCENLDKTSKILEEVAEYVDIIEMGTPLLMECGLPIVTQIKEKYPQHEVLADLKIMDAGQYEAGVAFAAGADIVTVMAATEDATIKAAVDCANAYEKAIMADLLAVKDLEARIERLEEMGVHYICLHTSKDLQRPGMSMDEHFGKIQKHIKTSKIALAGGITAESVDAYVRLEPEVIIVGEGIMTQGDRTAKAKLIREKMN